MSAHPTTLESRMHVFTRYIATYIVLPAGLIGAFALATATNADAAVASNTSRPAISALL
ncbi:hypothetical protein AB4Z42_14020 [Mycobacterium sp. 2YAF39]|uniref:hypothetical protein n=1 Tax=Mycobacterium sp. 2YAF39 TaxID=3233033 RepID=UPI003F9E51B3